MGGVAGIVPEPTGLLEEAVSLKEVALAGYTHHIGLRLLIAQMSQEPGLALGELHLRELVFTNPLRLVCCRDLGPLSQVVSVAGLAEELLPDIARLC